MMNSDDVKQMNAVVVLESLARAMRTNAEAFSKNASPEFAEGLRFAYLDALSVLMDEAKLHSLPLGLIGLEGYDPYADPHLIVPTKARR